jgi:hypothetical protein
MCQATGKIQEAIANTSTCKSFCRGSRAAAGARGTTQEATGKRQSRGRGSVRAGTEVAIAARSGFDAKGWSTSAKVLTFVFRNSTGPHPYKLPARDGPHQCPIFF